jgi:aquaporin Z
MKAFLVEFAGTFLFVLTFGLTVVPPSVGPFAPLAIGLMLAAMVYAGGPVSGGHYNPAVTLAVWLRGRCAGRVVLPYVLAQLVAGALAGVLVNELRTGGIAASAVPTVHDHLKLAVVEFVFTFALAYVFLAVATSLKSSGNSSSGLAVGVTVIAGMYAGLPLSGGMFNPAVSVGSSLMGLGSWELLWLYVVAQLAAGSVAAIAHRATSPEELQK